MAGMNGCRHLLRLVSQTEKGVHRPLWTESCFNRRGHLCGEMDRRLMDGMSAASTRRLHPISSPFFLRFVICLPVLDVRCSLSYNEPGSEHTSSQMSNFRSPHWGNCKHKSSKVYNFGDLVFEFCHFSSATAFLQRQTLPSFITRSLVL